jgi:hypothetical protein
MKNLILLILLPLKLTTHPLPSVRVQKLDYSEHVRNRLNKILEIPEGKNYWDKEFKTIIYENKLKEYFNKTYGKDSR